MHSEMVCMVKTSVKKFNGVHLNKLLGCQRKGFKDLPVMNDHKDDENEKYILCHRKALGFRLGGNCNFRHVAGMEYPQYFVVKLCTAIRPGVKKIMDQGVLPGGLGSKKRHVREGRGG